MIVVSVAIKESFDAGSCPQIKDCGGSLAQHTVAQEDSTLGMQTTRLCLCKHLNVSSLAPILYIIVLDQACRIFWTF